MREPRDSGKNKAVGVAVRARSGVQSSGLQVDLPPAAPAPLRLLGSLGQGRGCLALVNKGGVQALECRAVELTRKVEDRLRAWWSGRWLSG